MAPGTRNGILVVAALTALFSGVAAAQQIEPESAEQLRARLHNATHIVVPQTHALHLAAAHPHRRPPAAEMGIHVESVNANVEILEQTATTTLEVKVVNRSHAQAEAVILMPVPEGAAVSNFMFEGAASEPTAEILPRDEARRIYESIVASLRDPALLEFVNYNLIRSSVFPVEPGKSQRVRLTYESILEGDGNRIDYVLPRSESLAASTPWSINVDIRTKSPISMVYSPTHDLVEERQSPERVTLAITEASKTAPGPFRISYLLERDGVTASLFAYPDPKVGGGYFLLLAGLPATIDEETQRTIRRDVTLVLDRSGSMAGEKLDQAKAAALQIIEGLGVGETFNIIDYSTTVSKMAAEPVSRAAAWQVEKNSKETMERVRSYLADMRPGGGTNIHDALVEALRQKPFADHLPIVLFLTDGLPTVGNTSELAIRELVEKHNPHNKRIFTFGVGADVNVPLLDRVAEKSRGRSAYVLPGEDVEVKVAQTFKRLYGPVFADIEVATRDQNGEETTQAVRELIPAAKAIPDVFEGDHVVLLGQYRDVEALRFAFAGNYLGNERTFTFSFDLENATTQNAFVPRLWASRRIAYLVDEIRQAGAFSAAQPGSASVFDDPRYRELSDEILRLSTEFGILSEYTSFLAREGTNLGDWETLVAACSNELEGKAVRTRSGLGAVNQSLNVESQKAQARLKYDNRYWNAQMESVAITNVQQVNDRAFLKQGRQWIDTRLIAQQETIAEPDRVIEFGSSEHLALVRELAAVNRAGCVALAGDILIEHNGERILIRIDEEEPDESGS